MVLGEGENFFSREKKPKRRLRYIFSPPLSAGDQAELKQLRRENQMLRRELDRLRKEATQRDKDLLLFRRWAAGVADNGKIMKASERESRLMSVLQEFLKRSNGLVLESMDLERTVRELLKDFPLSPARQARLEMITNTSVKYGSSPSTGTLKR